VWDTFAGDHTCGSRITWLRTALLLDELAACTRVAGDEHPEECGGCDPEP
jgi:hypothetical protein